MEVDLPDLRPPVLSSEVTEMLDEFLRFRHVVRNVYTFSLKPEGIERLVGQARVTFERAKDELGSFASFLEHIGQDQDNARQNE